MVERQDRWRQAVLRAQDPEAVTLILDDIHHLETGPEAVTWLLDPLHAPAPRLVGQRFPGPGLDALRAVGRVPHP